MYWGPMDEGPLAPSFYASFYPLGQRWDTLAASLGDLVLEKCPRWLVFVEGVGHCMADQSNGPCTAPSAVGQQVGSRPMPLPQCIDRYMSVTCPLHARYVRYIPSNTQVLDILAFWGGVKR